MEAVEFFTTYIIFCLFIWLFGMAYSIACYVMGSLGNYTVAKRRGIDKPWLAWIPVVDTWILGCISDQYRYVVKGENKSKRKILLGLNIAQVVFAIIFYVVYFTMFIDLMVKLSENYNPEAVFAGVFSTMGIIMLLCIPMMVLSVVYTVFNYMAMYDLYTSCDPKNNVLFLLLAIFLGIHPFIIFFIRKKDLGMPPRREPVQTAPLQIEWQPQQAWQPPQPEADQPTRYYWQPEEPANNTPEL